MKIRTQLTIVVTVLVALVVTVAGLLTVVRTDHRDADDLDRMLADRAATVRTAAVRSGSLPTDGSYAIRLMQGGSVKKQVGSTVRFPLPVRDGYSTVSAGGQEWRSFSELLITGAQMQILIGLDARNERHTDNVLMVDLLVVLAALLSAAGVWFATGLVLKPFQRLLATVRTLDPGARLPEVSSPREVAELTVALNGLLDRTRVENAVDRTIEIPRLVDERPPAPAPAPVPEPEPTPEPLVDLRPQLDGLGANLEALMDNPDMPATQRHLLLAAMADEHREIVARLDPSSDRA